VKPVPCANWPWCWWMLDPLFLFRRLWKGHLVAWHRHPRGPWWALPVREGARLLLNQLTPVRSWVLATGLVVMNAITVKSKTPSNQERAAGDDRPGGPPMRSHERIFVRAVIATSAFGCCLPCSCRCSSFRATGIV